MDRENSKKIFFLIFGFWKSPEISCHEKDSDNEIERLIAIIFLG